MSRHLGSAQCDVVRLAVHHLVSTGLRCAPSTCIVHHQPAFCTRGACVRQMWGSPRHFSFFDGSQGTCKKGHFLSVFGGALEHTTNTLPGGGAPYVVRSAHINPSILIG